MRVTKLWNHEFKQDLSFHFTTWEVLPLRGSAAGGLVTCAPQQAVDKAYRGYSRELTDRLGPDPYSCLVKMPKSSRLCRNIKTCKIYIPDICCTVPKSRTLLPWCYEPSGIDSDVLQLTAQVVQLWAQGVYVVVIEAT